MFYTMRLLTLLSVIVLASSQYHYNHKSTFRPSPVDNFANAFYNNYHAADYYAKPPQFQPLSNFYQSTKPNFDLSHYYDQPPSKPLFVPAQNPYPAETEGQVNNYNQALQEEAEALIKEHENENFYGDFFKPDDHYGEGAEKSYVNVKFGGQHESGYQYSV